MGNKQLELEDFILIASGHASSTINKLLNRAFKNNNLDITTEQWSILSSLWKEDKQTQNSIAKKTFKEKASITRLIDNLADKGYVIRFTDSADRRSNFIHLTEKGFDLEHKAMEIIKNYVRIATSNLSMDDILFTKNILKTIQSNLQKEL